MSKPTKEVSAALAIATVYAGVGCAYIFLSTSYVATASITKEELEALELSKGLGFIAVTSLLLFASVAIVLRRMRQRDRLISGTFAAIDEAVVLIDQSTGAVLDCSPSTEAMFGVTRQELLTQGLDLLLADATAREAVRAAMDEAARSNQPGHVDLSIATAANPATHARVSLTSFEWKKTRVVAVTVADTTDDRQSQAALREQAATLTERVKELRGLYAISRESSDVSRPLSERMAKVVELIPPAWQMPERTFARVSYDGGNYETEGFKETAWRQSAEIAIRDRAVGSVEIFVDRNPADADTSPFLPEEQDLINEIARRIALAIEQDRLSEQQEHALEASRQSERRFHSLSEAVPLPVLVSDRQSGSILYANSRARDLMVKVEPGADATPFYYRNPDARRVVLTTLDEIGRIAGYEVEIRTGQDEDLYIEVYAETIDFDGTPAIITTFLDVTEKRLAEEAFLHAQKMESVGRLTGGVAHDFNNLLTVIIGNADFLIEEAHNSSVLKWAENLKKAAERGAALTQRLLASSRQQTLRPERFDVNKLLGGMLIFLNRTLGEDVAIETAFAEDLWPVSADMAQVEQALLNLAINARDAMPTGGSLTLATANVPTAEASALSLDVRDFVKVSVSDTGVGIAREQLDRVFDPFFTTKEVGKGTGLGLSMVYGFAKQSGGVATIDSEPGKGTTVSLYLPTGLTDGIEEAEPAYLDRAIGLRAHVLVVEDERLVRDTVAAQLAKLGHSVLTAGNAEEALPILSSDPEIDVLFTDIVMPGGMSGIDLAERALDLRPALKVVFTTGYTDHSALTRLADMIDARVLQKPYGTETLGAVIQEALALPKHPSHTSGAPCPPTFR